MLFNTIIRQDITFAHRFALCAALVFLGLGVVPAKADLIIDREVRSFWSPDYLMTATELFGDNFHDRAGCSPSSSEDRLNYHSVPIIPQLSETPLIGWGIPSSSGATGAGSDSSNSGSGFSAANAILCWLSELPRPMLVGQLYSVEDLDIPPAPPFELLRPPQVLTILA